MRSLSWRKCNACISAMRWRQLIDVRPSGMSSPGLAHLLDNTQPSQSIPAFAMDGLNHPWQSVFGEDGRLLSAKSLFGSQCSTGYGHRTGGLGMGFRMRAQHATRACRMRIMLIIFFCSARMLGRSGIGHGTPCRLTLLNHSQMRITWSGGYEHEEAS